MPRWINSDDRLPKHGVSVLVEYRSGRYVKMEFNGCVPRDWWERNIIRWLDQSEPSFTIEDMKKCFSHASVSTHKNCHTKEGKVVVDWDRVNEEEIEYFKKITRLKENQP